MDGEVIEALRAGHDPTATRARRTWPMSPIPESRVGGIRDGFELERAAGGVTVVELAATS